ncbi:MAG: hypothetical protein FWC11_05300, partial [Firmicutes bacterium]|nr:hypothetical protein [Bacillota bacterium]
MKTKTQKFSRKILTTFLAAVLVLSLFFGIPPVVSSFAFVSEDFSEFDFVAGTTVMNFINGYEGTRVMLIKYQGRLSFGNAIPTDENAQWRVFTLSNNRTILRNEGSGEYLGLNENFSLRFFETIEEVSHGFRILPASGTGYAGVRFNGPQLEDDRFLNIQHFVGGGGRDTDVLFNNEAQPTWGTPHWEPLNPFDNEGLEGIGRVMSAPTGYVRIVSRYGYVAEGEEVNGEEEREFRPTVVLMQNRGAFAHGSFRENDGRTHWRFESAGDNFYFLINRLTGQLAVNQGNNIVNVLDRETAIVIGGGQGARWRITSAGRDGVFMIGNIYNDRPIHVQPFINVSMAGQAVSSLVSILDERAYWAFETAPDFDEVEAPTEVVRQNAFDNGGLFRASDARDVLTSTYRLQRYGNQVRLQDSATNRFVFFDGENFRSKVLTSLTDTDTLWNIGYRLGVHYISMRGERVEIFQIEAEHIYTLEDAHLRDDRIMWTVFSARTGTFSANIVSNEVGDIQIRVNELERMSAIVPANNINIPLRKGLNVVEITGETSGIRSLVFHQIMARDFFGASFNRSKYEAEHMETNAEVILESRAQNTIAAESSGRSAVRIVHTTQFVRWTSSSASNAIVVRASVPDFYHPDYGHIGRDYTLSLYANNVRIGEVDLTSRYSWLYGGYAAGGGDGAPEQWSNDASLGNARMFFSESRKVLPQEFPAGTVFMLRKNLSDHAVFYYVDFVEMELIEEAYSQPANSISITTFGAVQNLRTEQARNANLNALKTAMNVALGTEDRTVFIPRGIFYFPQEEHSTHEGHYRGYNVILGREFDNLTIRGAGIWHTEIRGGLTFQFGDGMTGSPRDTSFFDMSFVGNEIIRRNAVARATFEGSADGFIAHNLWINRYKCAFWFDGGSNYFISGNRVHDLFADGVNLTLGAVNSKITQNCWRYPGDDAIAQWSNGQMNYGNVVSFNTVALPWLANGIAAYGGHNLTFKRNIVRDTIYVGAAINISTNF